MFRLACIATIPLIAAVLLTPIGIILDRVSATDRYGIYVVLGTEKTLDHLLLSSDIHEVSPYRAPFSRMVIADAELHAFLVENNYWVIPGAAIAERCGIDLPV